MSWTPTDEQDVATALGPFVQLPADKRDWSASVRDAYEHHAVTDFTEAYAAARRVYLREAARAVLVAVRPMIAAQGVREYVAAARENGWIGTWDAFDALNDAEQWADTVEKEAGR